MGLGLDDTSKTMLRKKSDFYSVKGDKISSDTVHLAFCQAKSMFCRYWPIKVSEQPSIQPVIKLKTGFLRAIDFLVQENSVPYFCKKPIACTGGEKPMTNASIWTPVIERTARKKNQKFELTLASPFPLFKMNRLMFRSHHRRKYLAFIAQH